VQQVSAITRKRLASRALERLEKSQVTLDDIRSTLSTLKDNNIYWQQRLEDEQREQEAQLGALGKCRQQNIALHDRIQDLEGTIQEHEQAAEVSQLKVHLNS
jgi:hypothetical protein